MIFRSVINFSIYKVYLFSIFLDFLFATSKISLFSVILLVTISGQTGVNSFVTF